MNNINKGTFQSTDVRLPKVALPYDPAEFPRETSRHYISATEKDISEMLSTIGLTNLNQLFSHISPNLLFPQPLPLPEEKEYFEAADSLFSISQLSSEKISFIGDQLPTWKTANIVDFVSNLRQLTTSYTPYQPERSQGTLISHWIYQCALSALTGFEAINTSLYDRSFAIYEAITCAIRTSRKPTRILLASSLFPQDIEVLETLSKETDIKFEFLEINPDTGRSNYEILANFQTEDINQFAGFVFPQVNSLGVLEDVDLMTDFCENHKIRSIACVDPFLLGDGGLKPPVEFGKSGADFIAGDAQHLAIPPNFGGPGLGIFGCRHNDQKKSDLRNTPGRYIGQAKDINGRDCHVMVLSTREQHIRKEKATSNVCSNQAFLATLAGASLLSRGSKGIGISIELANRIQQRIIDEIIKLDGVDIAFNSPISPTELVIRVNKSPSILINNARSADLHLGIDVTSRCPTPESEWLIKLSFSDIHSSDDVNNLISFFKEEFYSQPAPSNERNVSTIPTHYLRSEPAGLSSFSDDELKVYYTKLAELNVSPDDGCYPLGSCTMKYNPLLNDWAAGLDGFSKIHPQSPIEDAQGPLKILHEIQEWFKQITGLPGVTTQPVAGAQGELVGIKLFQAYHRNNGEENREYILIPRSAHGTNFATAAMAGCPEGIIYLEANDQGMIDTDDFHKKIQQYGPKLCGVMITNPNTSGIFENDFKLIADKVHQAGGLVYMDGANMNAIAGVIDLGELGVDAVHNNLHKTWTIPHGGGGPGDAIVAVSDKLIDFLPGKQIVKLPDDSFNAITPKKSIGSFHRNWGNFGHKVRAYSYLIRLGHEGIPRMSSIAVLSARYLFEKLRTRFSTLPEKANESPRMHEFILTLSDDDFSNLETNGIPKNQAIPQIGKLFLDFGFHAPTVAFPEIFGLMIEPTESYTKKELDRFIDAVFAIKDIIEDFPYVLKSAPHFTPIDKVDEVTANRKLSLYEKLDKLPSLPHNRISPSELMRLEIPEIKNRVIKLAKDSQGLI
jgi:glycine dehydrogenase